MLRLSLANSVFSVAAAFFSVQLQAPPETSDDTVTVKITVEYPASISIKAATPAKINTSRPIAIAVKKISADPNTMPIAVAPVILKVSTKDDHYAT